jgi:hypothetical protein
MEESPREVATNEESPVQQSPRQPYQVIVTDEDDKEKHNSALLNPHMNNETSHHFLPKSIKGSLSPANP